MVVLFVAFLLVDRVKETNLSEDIIEALSGYEILF